MHKRALAGAGGAGLVPRTQCRTRRRCPSRPGSLTPAHIRTQTRVRVRQGAKVGWSAVRSAVGAPVLPRTTCVACKRSFAAAMSAAGVTVLPLAMARCGHLSGQQGMHAAALAKIPSLRSARCRADASSFQPRLAAFSGAASSRSNQSSFKQSEQIKQK